jgi:hypothetical protein
MFPRPQSLDFSLLLFEDGAGALGVIGLQPSLVGRLARRAPDVTRTPGHVNLAAA